MRSATTGDRRVENDVRDAQDLAAMLALGRLAEGWITPPEVRELRELVPTAIRSSGTGPVPTPRSTGSWPRTGSCPSWASCGDRPVRPSSTGLELPEAYAIRLDSLRNLLDVYEHSIAELDAHIHAQLKADSGYQAVMTLPGVGKVIAAIFVAEIGDITRFDSAKKLCSWAGLTPKHRESDEVVHRGEITKQGSPLVRWAAIEAVGNYRAKGNEKLPRRLQTHC